MSLLRQFYRNQLKRMGQFCRRAHGATRSGRPWASWTAPSGIAVGCSTGGVRTLAGTHRAHQQSVREWRKGPRSLGLAVYLFLPTYIACHVSAIIFFCQCGVQDLVYVCNIETWSKFIQVLHFSQRDPFQKEIRLALFSLKRHLNQNW